MLVMLQAVPAGFVELATGPGAVRTCPAAAPVAERQHRRDSRLPRRHPTENKKPAG